MGKVRCCYVPKGPFTLSKGECEKESSVVCRCDSVVKPTPLDIDFGQCEQAFKVDKKWDFDRVISLQCICLAALSEPRVFIITSERIKYLYWYAIVNQPLDVHSF